MMVNDLPGGSGRLSAEAIGIEKVFVNGRLSVDGNVPTGTLAGSVLKSGRDTDTVTAGSSWKLVELDDEESSSLLS